MNITGGKFNSRKVIAPTTDKVRPTLSKIRASIFNTLSAYTDFKNASFLDAFAGSGIMSLEAVSRGFKEVITIEKDIKTAKIIKENFKQLNLTPNLIIRDATKVIGELKEQFDIIYLDPPYKNLELYNTTLNKIVENKILKVGGIVIVESQKTLEYNVPSDFTLMKEKIYGDTKVSFYQISDMKD